MNKNTKIYVKVDLLLHEKEFVLLRDFMRSSKSLRLNDYDYIAYSLKKECITTIHPNPSIPDGCVIPPSLQKKRKEQDLLLNDYILLTVNSLQKLLSNNH